MNQPREPRRRSGDPPEVVDNPEEGRFELRVDDALGFADYHLKKDVIVFTHTELPQALRGRGLGTVLVRAALDTARRRGLQVIPLCPYVAGFIRRHPQYRDLVVPRFRSLLDR